jgi:hypothetical protein
LESSCGLKTVASSSLAASAYAMISNVKYFVFAHRDEDHVYAFLEGLEKPGAEIIAAVRHGNSTQGIDIWHVTLPDGTEDLFMMWFTPSDLLGKELKPSDITFSRYDREKDVIHDWAQHTELRGLSSNNKRRSRNHRRQSKTGLAIPPLLPSKDGAVDTDVRPEIRA